jgi:hypothetical protein
MLGMLVTLGAARYMWGYERYTYRDPRTGKVYGHSATKFDPWLELYDSAPEGSGRELTRLKRIVTPTKLARRLRAPTIAAVVAFALHVTGTHFVPPYRDWDAAWDKYGLEMATSTLDLPKPPQNMRDLENLFNLSQR